MMLEVTLKQTELFEAITQFIRNVTSSNKLTHAELEKLNKLHEQFEAVQEIFGQRLARAPEMNFPPPFSVVPGGKEDT